MAQGGLKIKLKLSLCFIMSRTMAWRHTGRVKVWLHAFFDLGMYSIH